jgi:hypothetical protein
MYISVDYDGTLTTHAFPEIGEPNSTHKAIAEFCKEMQEQGHKIILWTCREDLPERAYLTEAVRWCESYYGLKFDYVNENPEIQLGGRQARKIVADMYIDDKAQNVRDFLIFRRLAKKKEEVRKRIGAV